MQMLGQRAIVLEQNANAVTMQPTLPVTNIQNTNRSPKGVELWISKIARRVD
jgi:hypothetical protein